MELMLERLSESVASAESLEQLTRPLLEMLELISGLESLYLTSIDEEAGVQTVDYVRNAGVLFPKDCPFHGPIRYASVAWMKDAVLRPT
jgi:hypothetical protein